MSEVIRTSRWRLCQRAAKITLFAGALALSFLAFRRIDVRLILASMGTLSGGSVLLVLAMAIAQTFALATRLWIVFPHGLRPHWAQVARAFGFGQFANACLPGRAGDVMKVVTIARDRSAGDAAGQATATDATGVMLTDKAIDVVTLATLVLVFAPALVLGVMAAAMHAAWVAVAGAGLVVAAIVFAKRHWPAAVARITHFAWATWRTVRGVLTPTRLLWALALGVGAWLAEATSMLVLSSSFGLQLSLAHAIVGLLVLNLGIAVPVSVGNVGTYEAATAVGLASFGVPPVQAFALGALHHAAQMLAVALFALAFWVRDRIRARGRALLPIVPAVTPTPLT